MPLVIKTFHEGNEMPPLCKYILLWEYLSKILDYFKVIMFLGEITGDNQPTETLLIDYDSTFSPVYWRYENKHNLVPVPKKITVRETRIYIQLKYTLI